MARKTEPIADSDLVLKSEVDTAAPSLSYSPADRQMELSASSWTQSSEEIGTEGRASLMSVLHYYFSNGAESLEELKALEDCFLFGLTEIAKQRAKLAAKV